MKILPAIDIKGGNVVRLLRGDFNKTTVYDKNPVEQAIEFERAGAKYLHLVDLDGAKYGRNTTMGIIEEIIRNTDLLIETGGGIRDRETVEALLKSGVDKVILGTILLEDPKLTEEIVRCYGSSIAIGIDLINGRIATKGWLESEERPLRDILDRLYSLGATRLICTDITKDGAMEGPNLGLYGELKSITDMEVIASGGVTTLDDLRQLRESKADGAIIGRSLYEGGIDLKTAILEFETEDI